MWSRLSVWLFLAVALTPHLRGVERNAWPIVVATDDDRTGATVSRAGLGPLLADRTTPDGTTTELFRPLYMHQAKGEQEVSHFLYPLLTWRREGSESWFSFFQLVNNRHERSISGGIVDQFDFWPFYFSRQTGDPATSYRALLPIAGTIKNRFGKDELSWTAFPLYFRTAKDGRQTRYTPWPFVRLTEGAGHHGFELWPLFGRVAREGDYRRQYYVWPLIYKQETNLSAPQPNVSAGFLPFYSRATAPGFIDENYLWPFFGYTDRTAPKRYHETRYFWPFLVQGRGEERYVNRWGPLYTHSVTKGYDKTWLLWPLVRHAEWREQGLAQERNQFLYVVYWSHTQRSLTNPAAAPAYKKHLWPLFSVWDNGAGRRQLQVLSPFEVFFTNNQPVRELYSPLFALYRFEQRAPGDSRWIFLWGLASSRRTAEDREFHLGPLFSTRRSATTGSRIAVGNGLISWRRTPGDTRWRFSLFDFRTAPAQPAPAAATTP